MLTTARPQLWTGSQSRGVERPAQDGGVQSEHSPDAAGRAHETEKTRTRDVGESQETKEKFEETMAKQFPK